MRVYNKTLSSKLFNDKKLNPGIRKKILQIVKDFLENVNIELPDIDDIQLTGSLANYNYNPKSDIDIHILLDFKKIDKDYDLVKTALDGIRFIWNTKHNIKLKGHDVELYFQDIHEPHVSSGLYSIQNKKWVIKPTYDPPSLRDEDILRKYNDIKFFINKLEELVDRFKSNLPKTKKIHDFCKLMFEKIKKMRAEGLTKDGGFSVGNMVFKLLRSTTYIGRLVNLINSSYDNIFNESLFQPNKIDHRQQHAIIRDPGTRKHATTVPQYLKINQDLPNCFKTMQKPNTPKFVHIHPKDAYTISKHFGISKLGRPKGCKKSGVAIGQKPNGQFYLMKTNTNKQHYLR